MDGKNRNDIRAGLRVAIVLKQDQRTGKLTIGIVKDLLTNSKFHPHGIKVRLTNGQVGRVQEILTDESWNSELNEFFENNVYEFKDN